MRVRVLFSIVTIGVFAIGCGGGSGGTVNPDNVNITKLINGKTFYEVDSIKNPPYRSYRITTTKYQERAFSDSKFTKLKSSKSYNVISFEDDMIELERDGIEYQCVYSYELETATKSITQLGLDCVPKDPNNENAEDIFILDAYPTKEQARKSVQ